MTKEELINNDCENEEIFQAKCMDFISNNYPQFRNKAFHIQNEQYIPKFINESPRDYKNRAAMVGSANKRKGKLAGVPDILIRFKGIMFSIELKLPSQKSKKNGGLSDEQVKIHDEWSLDCPNLPVIIVYNLFELQNTLNWILRSGFRVTQGNNEGSESGFFCL